MTIEPNPLILAESAFDDGYNKSKQDILNIIDRYRRLGAITDVVSDILYRIKEEIEKL